MKRNLLTKASCVGAALLSLVVYSCGGDAEVSGDGSEALAGEYAVDEFAVAEYFPLDACLDGLFEAMQSVLGHLNDKGSIAGIEGQLMMFAERQKVLDADKFKELERRYA